MQKLALAEDPDLEYSTEIFDLLCCVFLKNISKQNNMKEIFASR